MKHISMSTKYIYDGKAILFTTKFRVFSKIICITESVCSAGLSAFNYQNNYRKDPIKMKIDKMSSIEYLKLYFNNYEPAIYSNSIHS